MTNLGKSLSKINLENFLFLQPGIKIEENVNDKPRPVKEYHYCRSTPKVRNIPKISALSEPTLRLMGLDYEQIKSDELSPLYLSGSKLIPGSQPIAHNYSGHQFGSWAGQLGDGRAHTIGNISVGKIIYELQLKGSGKTPFSRHADGNSVLSSAVREFLASELMFGLHIPTTRAASLVIAEESVARDPFYNGKITLQKAAIVLRICQTFLRFGSLQVCNQEGQMHKPIPLQNRNLLKPICDYLIKIYFTDINSDEEDPYEILYQRLVKKSAELVAGWQSIGFCHGVLNTDNMSMIGYTIDYGPFAFIDYFSKDYISNASDEHERYSYRRQPQVVKWNLIKLAEAMDPLVPSKFLLQYLQQHFNAFYENKYYELMISKIGLKPSQNSRQIINELIEIMHLCGTNFTNLFRILQRADFQQEESETLINNLLRESCPTEFYLKNLRCFPQIMEADWKRMQQIDPAFNTFFITEQKKRYEVHQRLQNESCKDRTVRQKTLWTQWIQKYAKARMENKEQQILSVKYVLLNEIAKQITEEIKQMPADKHQQYFQKILNVLHKPFEFNEWFQEKYWKNRPIPVKLTCSS